MTATRLQNLPVLPRRMFLFFFFSIFFTSLLNNKFRLVIGREQCAVQRTWPPGSQGTWWEARYTFFFVFQLSPCWHFINICLYSYLGGYFHKDVIDCLLKIKFRKGIFQSVGARYYEKRRENAVDITLGGKPCDSNYGKISKIYINTSWTCTGKKTD